MLNIPEVGPPPDSELDQGRLCLRPHTRLAGLQRCVVSREEVHKHHPEQERDEQPLRAFPQELLTRSAPESEAGTHPGDEEKDRKPPLVHELEQEIHKSSGGFVVLVAVYAPVHEPQGDVKNDQEPEYDHPDPVQVVATW